MNKRDVMFGCDKSIYSFLPNFRRKRINTPAPRNKVCEAKSGI